MLETVCSSNVRIRPARAGELERVALLFLEEPRPGGTCYVAVKPTHCAIERIVGYAFVAVTDPRERRAQFRWRVLRRYAGSVLEDELIGAAMAEAGRQGADYLHAAEMLEAGSAADRLLERLGFRTAITDHLHEVDLAIAFARAERSYRLLARRRRLPSEMWVVPLDQQHWPATAKLAIREGVLGPACASPDVRSSGFSPSVSSVLIYRGEVAGTMLATVRGRFGDIASMVVAEELRGGTHWAHAVLARATGQWMAACGVEIIRYRAHPEISIEVGNFARRSGGKAPGRQHSRALKIRP